VASAADEVRTLLLFDGKSLDGWVAREPAARSRWKVAATKLAPHDASRLAVSAPGTSAGALVNDAEPKPRTKESRTVDLYTRRSFGDCTISLEFMVPKGGNSGVYVMGEYELQIEDNYGQKEVTFQDLGAIYKVAAARVNAGRKPGRWQSLEIEFRAPRFRDGKKVANARFVKVVLNGHVIHENVEPSDVTPGGLTGKEMSAGPLMLQGDHGPVAYRNIRVTVPDGRGDE
jgi:hypothetical protein